MYAAGTSRAPLAVSANGLYDSERNNFVKARDI